MKAETGCEGSDNIKNKNMPSNATIWCSM